MDVVKEGEENKGDEAEANAKYARLDDDLS